MLTMGLKHNVKQISGDQLESTINQNQFTLLYVYSSSCGYCSQFTPKFQKLSLSQEYQKNGVKFVKIDGQTYKDDLKGYQVYSFPTLLLFWKNYQQFPIVFRQQRTQQNIQKFLKFNTQIIQQSQILQNPQKMSVYQRIQHKIVLYYGQKNTQTYKKLGLIFHREQYFLWKHIQQSQKLQQKVVIGGKQLIGKGNLTIDNIQKTIKKTFARVHLLGQQSWSRIFKRKQLGIVYVNTQNNRRVPKILQQLSKKYENIVFMQIKPTDSEYKAAIKMMTVTDDQNIVAVDRKADAVFVAKQPHNLKSITDFIQKVQKYEWPVYRKTQKSQKSQKLTRANYQQKMSTPQDVIIFFYRREQKISKNLIQLFNHLRNKLKENKNLLFLRCDVSSNQLEQLVGISLEKTPKILFFRNRMKDKPIHFYAQKISQDTITEFIMENTTFDWEDAWGEL